MGWSGGRVGAVSVGLSGRLVTPEGPGVFRAETGSQVRGTLSLDHCQVGNPSLHGGEPDCRPSPWGLSLKYINAWTYGISDHFSVFYRRGLTVRWCYNLGFHL